MEVIEIKRDVGTAGTNYENMLVILEEKVNNQAANAIETLLSSAAKRLALTAAAKEGARKPAITFGLGHPYAVDAEGNTISTVGKDMPPIVAYRIAVPVVSGP